MRLISVFLFLLFSLGFCALQAQEYSNLRTRVFEVDTLVLRLDPMSMMPNTFSMKSGGLEVDEGLYKLNFLSSTITFNSLLLNKKVAIVFRVLDVDLSKTYSLRDTALLRKSSTEDYNYFEAIPQQTSLSNSLFGNMNKSGSLSRGISFGNSQDLSVNSNLNLQLNGQLNDRFKIVASISDDNIPIQPQGNTAQIQEFDKVFIKVFDKEMSLIAGDFQINDKSGYFLQYNKKAQGALFEQNYTLRDGAIKANLRAGAALSKGKFARNQMNGIEGNQGPYKLRGAENELFITVLSGTEVVYINGVKMKRGLNNDYIIDYNTAEVIFTTKRLVTKDSRIVVEFQYSDKNYARSVLQFSNTYEAKDWSVYVSAFGEQDSKNQPLQQNLRPNEIELMQNIGDNINDAVVTRFDSIEFNNEQVLYQLIDTLGYDSVFVYSTNKTVAFYRPTFSNVGDGNGDYTSNEFTANGRVFKWIKPDTVGNSIVHYGEFQPAKVLATPKKKQMITVGGDWALSPGIKFKGELAVSNNDVNTFSDKDEKDDLGWAGKWGLAFNQLDRNPDKKWGLTAAVSLEKTDANFNAIERFRDVEFTRNWNSATLNSKNNQDIIQGEIGLQSKDFGSVKYNLEDYNVNGVFKGTRHAAITDLESKHWLLESNSGLMEASGDMNSKYLRHKGKLIYKTEYANFGFANELEDNALYTSSSLDSISAGSFQFHDWQVFITNADSLVNKYKIYYRGRDDFKPRINDFGYATQVSEYGIELKLKSNRKHQLTVLAANREVIVKDTLLSRQKPESNLVTRVDYQFKWLKGTMSGNTFYEVGGGLEPKKEFIYLEVPAGQGVYVWIDYNGDDVKDLNEFEIAQYTYEANYIRTYIQSSDYVRIFTNGFNQNLMIRPEVLWAKKTGLKKFVSRFSNQSSLRLDRKTNFDDFVFTVNPFAEIQDDSVLVSLNKSIRNTVFFNKSNPSFNLYYTYNNLENKLLLANGFETRTNLSHEGKVHIQLGKAFYTDLKSSIGEKSNSSDFLSSRNYIIQTIEFAPELSWQKAATNRVTLKGSFAQKENTDNYINIDVENIGGEKAEIAKIGLDWQYSQLKKGIWRTDFNYVNISYNGATNNSLGYEMLNGLQTGNNYTWSVSLQKTLASNLQITVAYNGRKPEGINVIHNGSVQARAFF